MSLYYIVMLPSTVALFKRTQPPLAWTITQPLTGCVTWQHKPLVMFPPTQVELNTVQVIMLFQ